MVAWCGAALSAAPERTWGPVSGTCWRCTSGSPFRTIVCMAAADQEGEARWWAGSEEGRGSWRRRRQAASTRLTNVHRPETSEREPLHLPAWHLRAASRAVAAQVRQGRRHGVCSMSGLPWQERARTAGSCRRHAPAAKQTPGSGQATPASARRRRRLSAHVLVDTVAPVVHFWQYCRYGTVVGHPEPVVAVVSTHVPVAPPVNDCVSPHRLHTNSVGSGGGRRGGPCWRAGRPSEGGGGGRGLKGGGGSEHMSHRYPPRRSPRGRRGSCRGAPHPQ